MSEHSVEEAMEQALKDGLVTRGTEPGTYALTDKGRKHVADLPRNRIDDAMSEKLKCVHKTVTPKRTSTPETE